MAFSIAHQVGALAGTPITVTDPATSSGESTANVSASSVWKASAASLTCKINNPEMKDNILTPPQSPCRSPVLAATRPDLSVACQAYVAEAAPVVGHELKGAVETVNGVLVFMMMPLDSVTMNHTVNRKKAMNASLQALKSAGVEGIMMDVWWGLVERDVGIKMKFLQRML